MTYTYVTEDLGRGKSNLRKLIDEALASAEVSIKTPLGGITFKRRRTTASRESAAIRALAQVASKKGVVVFLDEIQDLTDIPYASSFFGDLRGQVQRLPETPFIFAGSSRTKMHQVFDSNDAPFYKQVSRIELGPIDSDRMERWVKARFRSSGRMLRDGVWQPPYEYASGVAGDVQRICAALYEVTSSNEEIGEAKLEEALQRILDQSNDSFAQTRAILSAKQTEVLDMLSIAETLEEGRILAKAEGIAYTTWRQALETLEKKGILSCKGSRIHMHDPFFATWNIRQNGLKARRLSAKLDGLRSTR